MLLTKIFLVMHSKCPGGQVVKFLKKNNKYRTTVSTGEDMVQVVASMSRFDIVILEADDCSHYGLLDIIKYIKECYYGLPVIVYCREERQRNMVRLALNSGVLDYIDFNDSEQRIESTIANVTRFAFCQRSLTQYALDVPHIPDDLIGNSQAIKHLRSIIKKTAQTPSRVMIVGGCGVGKSLVAKLIHRSSDRSDQIMSTLNPAGLSSQEIIDRLFNVCTGNPEFGILAKANRGVLYLHEIADLPLDIQLIVLQIIYDKGCINPLTNVFVNLDVRIIASSSKNMEAAVASGKLRDDLYHRLNVVPIRVPSLVEHIEDVPDLCQFFLHHLNRFYNLICPGFTTEVLALMQTYHWPGNVRQLRNVIERLLINCGNSKSGTITASMLSPELFVDDSDHISTADDMMISLPIKHARELFEKKYLKAQVTRFGGNISRTAHFVQMERSALHRKLKLLGIPEEA